MPAYANFTFQVRDDGGTANAGVDLDQSANTITIDVTAVNDAPGGADTTITTQWKTPPTRSMQPTSALAMPAIAPADAFLSVKITTLAGLGTLSHTDTGSVSTGDFVSKVDH